MIRKYFATLLIASTIAMLAGCNTMAGAGKDIEQGGGAIKDGANAHKSY